MDSHLLFLIHNHIEDDLILSGYILTLIDFDVGILETLVIKYFLARILARSTEFGVSCKPFSKPSFASMSSRSDFFKPIQLMVDTRGRTCRRYARKPCRR
jgi:hypothetical protein